MDKKLPNFGLFHFVGIGGIGMSGIAELMNKLGYKVQGSDLNIGSNIKRLTKQGIKVYIGHKKKNVANVRAVVFSSAIKKNNVELVESIKKKLPVISRAEMLGELMRFKKGISVAGSHGKTTTTSILGNIIEKAKLDPTIVNGGIINSLLTNSRMGNGDWMVVEADESDGSFLHLPNQINIITNIDEEHLDYYGNFDNLYDAFKKFSSNIPFYGNSVICLENKYSKKLSKEITTRQILTYGINKIHSDLNIDSIKYKNNKSYFSLIISSKLIKNKKNKFNFSLNLLGKHNILNATAAIGVSIKIGIKISIIKKALLQFKGVERRFSFIDKINYVRIYDDYAHHPKEIVATLDIARKICKGKIIVVFQPHRFSRTKLLFEDFIAVLKKIDVLVLADIYSAGENNIKGLNIKLFNKLKKISKNIVIKNQNEKRLYKIIEPFFKKNNIIIFMGAGSIIYWSKNFVSECRKKY